jgi:CIC family chloride channel protein
VLYLVLGLVSGLVAVSFKRLLIEGTHRADGVVLPLPARGALAGLFVGAVAAAGAYPVMGNGYAWMELVIGHPEQVGLGMLVVLLVAKPIATAVTAAGRTGAGLFAPSLYLGAVTGVAFGRLAGDLFPQVVSSPGAFGMVGMGAVAAAVLHAPITLTLMLFEMTGLYDVILPLLLTLATSGLISAMVGSESIYALELKARGLPLPSSRPRDALAGVRVTDLARASDLEVVRADTPLTDLLARFLAVRAQTVWVVGPDGRLDGAIELHDLKELLAKPREGLVAGDLVSRDVPRLHGEEPLADSVPLFFRSFREELPVVDGEGRLVGVLAQRDVVAAFHRALAEDEDVLIAPVRSGPSGLRSTDYVELPEGQALDVVALPDRLAGRTLRALGLPRTHGITVLATSRWDSRRSRWERLPVDPDAPIGRGDRLVIVGPAERIARWEALAEGIDDEQA